MRVEQPGFGVARAVAGTNPIQPPRNTLPTNAYTLGGQLHLLRRGGGRCQERSDRERDYAAAAIRASAR
jgi:hypothetical protein